MYELYETEQMNLPRWIREDRYKERGPRIPEHIWNQDWMKLPPLREVLEHELDAN